MARLKDFKFSLQKALDLFEDTWARDIGEDIVASHGEWKERQLANEFSNLLHSLLREGFFNDCEYYATTTSGSEGTEDEEANDQEVTEYDHQRNMDNEHYDHDHGYDHEHHGHHGHHGHDHDHHGHHHYHAHHAVDDSCDSGRGYVDHYDSDVETPRSESFSLSSERRRQARSNDPSINMRVGSRRSRHQQNNSRKARGSANHGHGHSNHSSSQSEDYDDEDEEVDGSEDSDEAQTRPNENNSVTGRVKRYLSKVLTKVKSGSSRSANSNKGNRNDKRRG